MCSVSTQSVGKRCRALLGVTKCCVSQSVAVRCRARLGISSTGVFRADSAANTDSADNSDNGVKAGLCCGSVNSVLERISDFEIELKDLENRLGDPDVQSNAEQLADLGRRFKLIDEIVTVGLRLKSETEDCAEVRAMLTDTTDQNDRDALRALLDELTCAIADSEKKLKHLLMPQDPYAGRNVILEIRGTAGGEEANLFARDLFEMYQAFAKRNGWRIQTLSSSISPLGGFTEISVMMAGEGAWTRMKHEAGPHRVQRVPVTESQGRVHTSVATVAVLPEAREVEVNVEDSDLQIDVYRSSGPGGQSVNTTDSAVRITHLPTGIVVSMQDEKSQLQNKQKALRVLRARLLQAEQDKAGEEQSSMRRGQVGTGDRSEKVRTYNVKENRVSDHRVGLTIYRLDRVLAGELDEISNALVHAEQEELLK